ncbi:hypothetical protein HPB50_003040 [Hyalomma asiaticum]|uniref:Uncharacterized protein n=1 Tax=Hyalomma asiaticum TaxID=266040 RepID=A0ACB7SG66_HYAAI|nr:hypothetical protein HPB50_003040 [Hyalomma asiaticum]
MPKRHTQAAQFGDVCVGHINYNVRNIVLAAIYLSPEAQQESMRSFLSTSLGDYTTTSVTPRCNNSAERSMPLVTAADFNVDVSKPNNACFTQYMKDIFDVHRISQDLVPTTRAGASGALNNYVLVLSSPPVTLEPTQPPWATLDQITVEPVPRHMDQDNQTGQHETRVQHLQEAAGEWILCTDASPSQTGEGF